MTKFLLSVLFLTYSCSHFQTSKPAYILGSRDGLTKTEQITLSDPYDKKITKLLSSAYINYKNNDFNKAIINYETARIFTADLDFWHSYALAYCYMNVGKYNESIKILENIINDKPEIANAYVILGFNYLRLGDTDKAIEQYNKALSLENYTPTTYYYLGIAHVMKDPKFNYKELVDKAKNEFSEILKKNPNDFETLLEYTYLFTLTGDLREAEEFLLKARNVINISPEVEELAYQQNLAPYQDPIWQHFYLNLIEGIILHKKRKYLESNHIFLVALQNPPSGSMLDIAEIYFYMSKNFKKLKNKTANTRALELAKAFDGMIEKRVR